MDKCLPRQHVPQSCSEYGSTSTPLVKLVGQTTSERVATGVTDVVLLIAELLTSCITDPFWYSTCKRVKVMYGAELTWKLTVLPPGQLA